MANLVGADLTKENLTDAVLNSTLTKGEHQVILANKKIAISDNLQSPILGATDSLMAIFIVFLNNSLLKN